MAGTPDLPGNLTEKFVLGAKPFFARQFLGKRPYLLFLGRPYE